MRHMLKGLADRVDALSLRERGAVFVGLIAIVYLAWDIFVLQPLDSEYTQLREQITMVQERVVSSSRRIQEMMASNATNPNSELLEEQEMLRKEIAILDERLADRTANVVDPSEMAFLLEQVLERQKGVRLGSINSLPAESVFFDPDNGLTTAIGIYRHGLEMELEGSYLDLLAYLRALEALDSDFFWESLDIRTEEYPRNRIRLRVYTLSLSEEWIGV